MSETITRPVLELKGVKLAKFLSQETPAYEATLWVDGRPFAHLTNDGHGGCDHVTLIKPHTWEDWRGLQARVEATCEPYAFDMGGGQKATCSASLESECHGLVWEHEERAHLKRQLARKGVIMTCEQKHGKAVIMEYRGKGYTWDSAEVRTKFRIHRPQAIVLQALSFEEAFELWKGVFRK